MMPAVMHQQFVDDDPMAAEAALGQDVQHPLSLGNGSPDPCTQRQHPLKRQIDGRKEGRKDRRMDGRKKE